MQFNFIRSERKTESFQHSYQVPGLSVGSIIIRKATPVSAFHVNSFNVNSWLCASEGLTKPCLQYTYHKPPAAPSATTVLEQRNLELFLSERSNLFTLLSNPAVIVSL